MQYHRIAPVRRDLESLSGPIFYGKWSPEEVTRHSGLLYIENFLDLDLEGKCQRKIQGGSKMRP